MFLPSLGRNTLESLVSIHTVSFLEYQQLLSNEQWCVRSGSLSVYVLTISYPAKKKSLKIPKW